MNFTRARFNCDQASRSFAKFATLCRFFARENPPSLPRRVASPHSSPHQHETAGRDVLFKPRHHFAALAPGGVRRVRPRPPPRGRTVRAVLSRRASRHRRVAARASFAASTPPSGPDSRLFACLRDAPPSRGVSAPPGRSSLRGRDAADDAFPARSRARRWIPGARTAGCSALRAGQRVSPVHGRGRGDAGPHVRGTRRGRAEAGLGGRHRGRRRERPAASGCRAAPTAAWCCSDASRAMRASERRNGVQDVMYANI